MWHASAASKLYSHEALERIIRLVLLDGIGDAGAEWLEHRQGDGLKVVHLRRLLTPAEARQVGGVRDLRGTDQEKRRAETVARRVPGLSPLALQSMG